MFSAQQTQEALGATQQPQPDPVREVIEDVGLFLLGRWIGKRISGK